MDLFGDPALPTDETRALLALHLVPGIGPRLLAALVERFGSARQVLVATPAQLTDVEHIGPELGRRIRESLDRNAVDEELALMRQHSVHVAIAGQLGYPPSLAEITSPPSLIYVAGQMQEQDSRAVAIVGSRACSAYGRRVAERLAGDLARAGVTVVSGLARGIDGCAHRGALNAGGRTIAVLAGGLSKIYPPEHANLANEVKANGALISESAMRMEPMAGMFPARNRIISGMSQAVVVVEAAEKSGALITAVHAAEQGRDVFAIPGPVDSAHAGGTLKLLRQGARLARHAGDILEDLHWLRPGSVPSASPPIEPPGLQDPEKKIWQLLLERPQSVDQIAQALGQSIAELAGTLMGLELKKIIRRLPGNVYERI